MGAAQLRHEGHGQFCSRSCKYAAQRKESRLPRVSEGRVMIHAPNSAMAGKDGYVYRYRLVMAEKIGRPLQPSENVHHVNGDSSDDRPENLMLTTRTVHRIMHAIDHARRRGYDLLTQKRCQMCKQVKLRSEFSSSVERGRRTVNGKCKPCAAAFQRQYRVDHPDRVANSRSRKRKSAEEVRLVRSLAGKIGGVRSGEARRAKRRESHVER